MPYNNDPSRSFYDNIIPQDLKEKLAASAVPTAAGSEEPKCVYCGKPIEMQEVGYIHVSREDGFNCPNKFPEAAPVASQAPPPASEPSALDKFLSEVHPIPLPAGEDSVSMIRKMRDAEATPPSSIEKTATVYIGGLNGIITALRSDNEGLRERVGELEEAQEGWSANAMEHLGRVRAAKEIIEQYPPMVRNILGGKAVRNVSELEASAKSWLEKYHE